MGYKNYVVIESQCLESKLVIPCGISDTIATIQRKIEEKSQVPVCMQSLYYSRNVLGQDIVLKQLFQESRVLMLSLDVLIKGGAVARPQGMFTKFEFKDMTTDDCFEVKRLGSGGPRHHSGANGINIIASCVDNNCKTMMENDYVVIQKGMYDDTKGMCNLRKEVFRLVCPVCNQKISPQNVENIAFIRCKIKIEWMLEDGNEGETKLEAEGDEYTTLKSSVDYKLYEYLDITVT